MNSYYNLVSDFATPHPKDVEGMNNTAAAYYQNNLFNIFKSLFRIENAPDSWDLDYIMDRLFRVGYLCAIVKDGTAYCLEGGYSGINAYGKPTRTIVANPVLGQVESEIGKKSELLYFNYNRQYYENVSGLITRYAVLLAQCDGSINTSLINSRVAHLFYAKSKAELATLERIYDEVSAGKPAVFIKKPTDEMMNIDHDFLDVKNVFIAPEINELKQSIKNDFLTEIGINNINNQKKERMLVDEVNANDQETKTLIEMYIDTLNACLERINKMYRSNGIESNIKFVLNRNETTQMREDEGSENNATI